MNYKDLLIFGAAFFVFIKASKFFLMVKYLMNLRYNKADGQIKQLNDLPDYLQPLLYCYDTQLENFGFSISHLHLLDTVVVNSFDLQWNLVYFNQSNNCYANVYVSTLPEVFDPVKIEFNNIFTDNGRLTTVNGTGSDIISEIPNVIINDPYAPTLDQQYNDHIEKISTLNRQSISLSPQEYLDNEIKLNNDDLDFNINKRDLKQQDDSTWKRPLIPTIKLALKTLRALKKINAFNSEKSKNNVAHKIEPIEIPVQAEVDAYLWMENIFSPSESGLWSKIMVFIISLILCFTVLGTAFSFTFALAIIGALIVHELGHYFAMMFFGYRDRQILFFPLGAATTGKKPNVTTLQEVVVFLSGPALGLIAGAILAIAGLITQQKSMFVNSAYFLILNYINLMPIVPLDGGRVFELALFSRKPILKSAFMIISFCLVATAAILLKDPLIIIFAVLLLFGIRSQVQNNSAHSTLLNKIKEQQIPADKESILPEIFSILKQKPFAQFSFAKKYKITKSMIEKIIQPSPRLYESVTAVVLYLTVVAIPVFIILPAFIIMGIKLNI